MTLILSCLTSEYAIQVSDRRLVRSDGRILDDHSNKAILVNGHIIFGYTGLAYMDSGKTKNDEWFLNVLNEAHKVHPNASLTITAEYVAKCATDIVCQIKASAVLKRLAFVGIGWGRLTGKDELCPIYVAISNMHDNNGKLLSQAQPDFSVLVFTPPDNMPVMLVSDGQLLSKEIRKKVLRSLKKCVENGVGPKTMARILVATVRNVASTNQMVGRNLLVNSIPKAAVHPGISNLIGSYPRPNNITFTYVPENTPIQVQYAPKVFAFGVSSSDIIVCRGSDYSPHTA